jgi:hypothetical protein
MKYTQNKKIEQVNESTLIIGADIAKQKHITGTLVIYCQTNIPIRGEYKMAFSIRGAVLF